MSEVRRDRKNRRLRDGETQLSDGRYRFRYKGIDGKDHDIYAWQLEETDRVPKGKRAGLPLRTQERRISAALAENMILNGGELTVVQLCERYLATKVNVKPTTQTGYQTVMNILKSVPFGNARIDKIRELDAQEFLVWLQQSEGKGYSTIHNIRGVLRPAFRLAVKNDFIRKTPFDFPLADVVVDDSVRREAITCFERVIADRPVVKNEPVVDGYTGFLFLDKDGKPTVALHWEHYFSRIVAKYNKIYKEEMPKVTPHVCRHTYCSNMAKSGMNPKVLQYLMGHSDIGITLDTYTHLKTEDAREELQTLEKQGKIS